MLFINRHLGDWLECLFSLIFIVIGRHWTFLWHWTDFGPAFCFWSTWTVRCVAIIDCKSTGSNRARPPIFTAGNIPHATQFLSVRSHTPMLQ